MAVPALSVSRSTNVDPAPGAPLQAHFHELPIATHSVDLAVLPHVLEFAEKPHDILREIDLAFTIHRELGSNLGGVHIELTGEDVTECIGGAAGVREDDLTRNYVSLCDPRLNYQQALEMAFLLARKMAADLPRR